MSRRTITKQHTTTVSRHMMTIVMLTMLYGCTTTETEIPATRFENVSVSTSVGELTIDATDRLSWYSEIEVVSDLSADKIPKFPGFQAKVRDLTAARLRANGFTVADDVGTSRYQIVAVALLGESADAQRIQGLFQLYPTLAVTSDELPTGTLMLAILDSATHQPIWRGATQLLLDADATPELREQRLRATIDGLLEEVRPSPQTSGSIQNLNLQ